MAGIVSKQDPINVARKLIAQKKYDSAERLLWGIAETPEVINLLRRVNHLKKNESKPSSDKNLYLLIIGVAIIAVVLATYLFVDQRNADVRFREFNKILAVESVCYDFYYTSYATIMTPDAYNEGCAEEAAEIIVKYPAMIETCYSRVGKEIDPLYYCLKETGVKFSGLHLYNRAKK